MAALSPTLWSTVHEAQCIPDQYCVETQLGCTTLKIVDWKMAVVQLSSACTIATAASRSTPKAFTGIGNLCRSFASQPGCCLVSGSGPKRLSHPASGSRRPPAARRLVSMASSQVRPRRQMHDCLIPSVDSPASLSHSHSVCPNSTYSKQSLRDLCHEQTRNAWSPWPVCCTLFRCTAIASAPLIP